MIKTKYVTSFFIVLSISTGVLNIIFDYQQKQLINKLEHDIQTLHENVSERFKLQIGFHRTIALMTSEVLDTITPDSAQYNTLAEHILREYNEILGLNILNNKGIITKVAPERYNYQALGKVTQNFEALMVSLRKDEPYWLSAPFQLYQGPQGFSFYVPYYQKEKFSGWVAPVISVDLFFKKFIKNKYLNDYHLIIQDKITGREYFSTGAYPRQKLNVFQDTVEIFGRKIYFISWPKVSVVPIKTQFLVSFLIALFVAALSTLSFYFYNQRTKTRERFNYLSSILNITIQDTNNALRTIHHQLHQAILAESVSKLEKILKHVSYASSLVRQIEILGKLTTPISSKDFIKTPILPVMLELSELYNESFLEKKLLFNYNPEELSTIEVVADKWLITHSVFAHFLRMAINDAVINSDINFEHKYENGMICFTISYTGQGFSEDFLRAATVSKKNYVAEKVIHLHKGQLEFANTPTGAKISIKLPTILI